ncbi:MAG: type II toxin-antitoxin system RelE/ParE family toxin [Candidatus Nomurabacteria bacterium]|jgi:mRNA interferase RelE/StbE|nr:type II toxin-antitoxin system RelE/ParE family toxin [Candidatus Nomurabacteria bacterium]
MAYKIVPTARFEKDLTKIGRANATHVVRWVAENLEGTDNPRLRGKRLKHDLKQYWRYRIGDYRLLVEIIDDELILELITIAHRREVYR